MTIGQQTAGDINASGAIQKAAPFITAVEPVSGSDNVYAYIYADNAVIDGGLGWTTSPVNKVIVGCTSDTEDVEVTVEVDAGTTPWQPTVTIYGGSSSVEVTLTPLVSNTRRFSGTAAIRVTDDATIFAATEDLGRSPDVTLLRAADPPVITSALFGAYPGSQTAVKGNIDGNNPADTIHITGSVGVTATKIVVKNAGASSSVQEFPGDYSGGAFDVTITVGSRSSATQTCTLYAENVGGTPGADHITDNTVVQSQTLPTFSGGSQSDIAYPGAQEALKDAETCDVKITHTNIAGGDTYLYDDNSTGELAIPSTTTYAATKASVARSGGTYRESGVNYRLAVTRTTQNGAVATRSAIVKIAHAAPVITVSTWSALDGDDAARLRSDDGTDNYYDHRIEIHADQARLSTDTPEIQGPPIGTFQGSWIEQTITEYRRDLRIADGDFVGGGQGPNTYAWNDSTTVSWVNRAGKETTTVTTGNALLVGGFDNRTLTHDVVPDHEMYLGVLVVDTAKLVAVNTSKGGSPTQAFESGIVEHNNSDPSLNNYFTISDNADGYDPDNQHYHNSDKRFADTVTVFGSAVVDVEETA